MADFDGNLTTFYYYEEEKMICVNDCINDNLTGQIDWTVYKILMAIPNIKELTTFSIKNLFLSWEPQILWNLYEWQTMGCFSGDLGFRIQDHTMNK